MSSALLDSTHTTAPRTRGLALRLAFEEMRPQPSGNQTKHMLQSYHLDDLISSPEAITVLHVDDDPAMLDLVATFLEREQSSISVESITTPEEVLPTLERKAVDCIVSDYDMPGMDGIELLTDVREYYPELPFILFTGKGSEEVASEAISAGVTEYMQKGTGTDQYQVLAKRISNVVTKAQAEEQVNRGYRAIETAQDGISLLDEKGRFTYVNQAYTEIYGYDREKFLGEHWGLLYRDEDIADVEAILEDIDVGDTWTGETTGVTKQGARIVEQHSLARTIDGGFVCTVRDITAEKQREETLKALHSATRRLMEAKTPEDVSEIAVETAEDVLGHPVNGIWLADDTEEALIPVAYTESADEILDSIPAYRPGNSLSWNVYTEGDSQVFEAVDEREDAYNSETPIKGEVIVPLGRHGVLNVGSQSNPTFDEPEIAFIETLAANVETALNRAERERSLREESTFTDDIIGALGDVLYVFDTDNRLVRWNDQLKAVTGYSDEELAGKHITDFAPGEHQDRVIESIAEMEPGESYRLQVPLVSKDGDQTLHEFTRTKFTDETKNPLGICGIGRDISERERQQRELKRQNERLERFASAVSHDLRTPLSVVDGRLQLAAELASDVESPLGSQIVSELDEATEALGRMEALIDDVLTLAREGRTIDAREDIALEPLIREAWTTNSKEDSDASLNVDGELGTITGDPDRLYQVFENLFGNAVKHSDEAVTITVFRTGDGIHIGDDGPGIPAAEREKILKPGYSSDESSTGFGLAIVSDIIEAHGWEFTVSESESGGAQFSIRWR